MTIDVGTGDGRAVLATAAREPSTLVLGMDASAVSMAESSRRAAGPVRKGGLENARFVVAAAECPPAALTGLADLVTVRFPWGSLLRGCAGLDTTVAAGLAGLVAPRGTLELLLAPAARDGLGDVPTTAVGLVDAAASAFAGRGFTVVEAGQASAAKLAASGSTWARRLGVARSNGHPAPAGDRVAIRVRLARR